MIAWTRKVGTDMSEIKELCEGNSIKAWFWIMTPRFLTYPAGLMESSIH